tara:strand:+ start:802 stop:1398 length:597 start_codon:yes stop_codon:yes gene_type:complete
MDKKTALVKGRYDRFSRFYDFLESPLEKWVFSKWRNGLLGDLEGSILEIGVGTGKNLKYYNEKAKVVGIDISDGMIGKAKKKFPGRDLRVMDAERLDFEDNSFDYVVCTFVLCSVPDPVKVVKEMDRVCKGKILMLEHVLSKNKLIALFEHIHNPFTRVLFGFNVNRKTGDNIRSAGLYFEEVNLGLFDIFKRFEVKK